MIKAIFFDLDGVLFDGKVFHRDLFLMTVAQFYYLQKLSNEKGWGLRIFYHTDEDYVLTTTGMSFSIVDKFLSISGK